MKNITVEDLRAIEVFKEVPEDQLQWMIDNSRHYELQEGEYMTRPGEELEGTHILFSGKIELYRIQNNTKHTISELLPGTITGSLPFSRGKIGVAFGQCVELTQIMTLPKDLLRHLIVSFYELTQALVIVMTSRVREFTELEQQNEKMMALGKLSAGLAHELNNPAAAIVRGSVSLKNHLLMQPGDFKKLISIHLSPEEVDVINNKMEAILQSTDRPVLSMMKRSEKEDEILDWLDDNSITGCSDIAENLVEFGITEEDLEELKSKINKNDLSPILLWINNNLTTERMVADIQEASKRIADLVGSVKTFTHMDRGGEREVVDIHVGIRNTIIMLNYKIKKANVKVIEEFDTTLPKIKAMVGELNQVWTNLIDNAIDALEGQEGAELKIVTFREKDFVKVAICDNGPGIPKEIRSKIFDPFFTTKSVGKGTGLGLDVVMRIVRQHHGSVTLQTEPGKTEFLVCFPING
ncbi:Adaptive-response sensory-kinase SasA [Dyadobacter sp. CECT 9623]|uniref:histidine kinase n=1 Tax=Dyadobacter linearis TaxID=2823330 RepID=A0ABN7R4D0_9BACT|nr:ATP-binding protein [Dyadobacter sp. CECT 9623]CAG5068833.1 Adaptive-response sensory-kinase SasA [Dyadobacter sp. CECT 9623]